MLIEIDTHTHIQYSKYKGSSFRLSERWQWSSVSHKRWELLLCWANTSFQSKR